MWMMLIINMVTLIITYNHLIQNSFPSVDKCKGGQKSLHACQFRIILKHPFVFSKHFIQHVHIYREMSNQHGAEQQITQSSETAAFPSFKLAVLGLNQLLYQHDSWVNL